MRLEKSRIEAGRAELRSVRRQSRALYWAVGVFSVFANLLMLTGPIYMLQVYDRVLSSRSVETLIALSVLVVFLYTVMGVLDFARGRIMGRVGARFQAARAAACGAGGASLSAPVARTLVDVVRRQHDATSPASPTRLDLTDRERDVLRCLVDGLTYKESATRLGVSPHTVRTHIRALYKKLQVSNVAEAVNRAIRERLT